ncbi:MAG: hypothetical protein JG782_1509 [Anaerophaga sp.]|nr:hypothetical protein [Anaerophaga sp.]
MLFIHQYKISLSYWSDGTRMIEIYTCSFVTIFVMLVLLGFLKNLTKATRDEYFGGKL